MEEIKEEEESVRIIEPKGSLTGFDKYRRDRGRGKQSSLSPNQGPSFKITPIQTTLYSPKEQTTEQKKHTKHAKRNSCIQFNDQNFNPLELKEYSGYESEEEEPKPKKRVKERDKLGRVFKTYYQKNSLNSIPISETPENSEFSPSKFLLRGTRKEESKYVETSKGKMSSRSEKDIEEDPMSPLSPVSPVMGSKRRYEMHYIDNFENLVEIKKLGYKTEKMGVAKMSRCCSSTGKTLMLDLDMTLITTNQMYVGEGGLVDKSASVSKMLGIEYWVRPYALELLENLSDYYEICIYSTAQESYIQDLLESAGLMLYIDHIFSRFHTVQLHDYILKFFKVCNRKYQNIIAVDDNFAYWPDDYQQLIPILPFDGDPFDRELKHIMEFLIKIKDSKNVKKEIAKKYKIQKKYIDYLVVHGLLEKEKEEDDSN